MLFMFYTYCLESQKTFKIYIGFTNNLKRRFEEHNKGKGGDFTAKMVLGNWCFTRLTVMKKTRGKWNVFIKLDTVEKC